MANHDHTLRKIDYKSTFPFIHLFRGFRLAIDPSKLVLALSALLLLYVGGRLLDAIWPNHSRAMEAEIVNYDLNRVGDFQAQRKQAAERRIRELQRGLEALKQPADGGIGDLKSALRVNRDEAIKNINETYDKLPADQKNDAAANRRDEAIQAAFGRYAAESKSADQLCAQGLFIHFILYEIEQADRLAASAVSLDGAGVFSALRGFFVVAPCWAITQHYVYFAIFFAFYILLMAITGGAISRISAVQVARDEKISIRQALRFSTGKVLSFIFAPLIPIIIIIVIGLVLALLSMWMSLPYLGGIWSIVVGALFVIALLAGLVMTLTALGLIGGGHLMYPTIAVEGSDSFDAVSRSFSYLYARPWQLIWYSLVALIYGAITYLFVRYFLYLLLVLTHFGVGLFMWGHAKDGADLMSTLWPAPPTFMKMSHEINYAALGTGHSVGATLIAMWVYLTLALLGAYAVSLYFSSSTIIYYLMRKEVDATAMDEVYIEPSDDEFADAQPEPTSPAPTPEIPSPAPPATPAPQEQPPTDQPPPPAM